MTKCFCFQTDFIIQFLATLVFNHDLFSQILFSSASWLGFCVLMKLWNLFPFIQRLFLSLFPQSRHTITLSTVIYHQSQRCYDVLYKDNLVLTQLVLRLYQFLWTLTIDWRSMTNKTQFKPIDEYLENLVGKCSKHSWKGKTDNTKTAPEAAETISHGIPRQHAYNLFKTLKRKHKRIHLCNYITNDNIMYTTLHSHYAHPLHL